MNRMSDKGFKDDIKKFVKTYRKPILIVGGVLGLRVYAKRRLKKEYIRGCYAGFNMTIDYFDKQMNVGLRQIWNDYKAAHPGMVLMIKAKR